MQINVIALLHECASLALAAGNVIKSVHSARNASGSSLLLAHLKTEGDVKSVATVADVRAQRVIMHGLQKYPDLHIVGEEEDDPSIPPHPADFTSPPSPLDLSTIDPALSIDSSSVTLFIDPLDGTHEFVSERVENCTTLIGVAVHGTPYFGVIGCPFSTSPVVAGGPTLGLFGLPSPLPSSAPRSSPLRLAASSSVKDPLLVFAQDHLLSLPSEIVVRPACGNKVLSIIRNEADLSCFNLKTSLWDTCATTALLTAVGGTVTDLTGCAINYSKARLAAYPDPTNSHGVLATGPGIPHAEITAKLRSSPLTSALFAASGYAHPPSGAPATDCARDILGGALTAAKLSEVTATEVTSYSCPEESAQRYLMSAAARIQLEPSKETLFFKRCVMRDLPHVALKAKTAPGKLARDVKSYTVEASFLASAATKKLSSYGVDIARCLHSEISPCASSPIDSSFSLLLSDFHPSEWAQKSLLDFGELSQSLKGLGQMHAFFLNGGVHNELLAAGDVGELADAVWPTGSHWAPAQQDPTLAGRIGEVWEKGGHGRTREDGGFGDGGDRHLRLGARLQEVAGRLQLEAHPGREHPHFTLMHGDFKSGNIFLGSGGRVGMIDFQWAGWGLGATDVAYCIAGCAAPDVLDGEGAKERELLKVYFDAFEVTLADVGGVGKGPTFDELVSAYEAGLVDLCKSGFGYHWQRSVSGIGARCPAEMTAERRQMLGPVAYNKDEGVARWLVARCDRLLADKYNVA